MSQTVYIFYDISNVLDHNIFILENISLHRSWSLEILLQYMDDGHVLSIMGAEKDYMISLVIQNRTPSLLLKGNTLQQVSGKRLNGSDSVELVHLN